jgi:hypothetical protein
MRDLLNLVKMLENSQIVEAAGPETSSLKSQIISQVKKTDDSELLQKIYTALNKGNLTDRIGLVLDRDTDTKGYVDQLTNLIIDVPGTYQEKEAFEAQEQRRKEQDPNYKIQKFGKPKPLFTKTLPVTIP